MQRKINIIGLTLFFTLTLFSLAFAEESMTITTYYPSPYGSYQELTAHRMKIGRTYSDASFFVDNDNLIVEGNVGIGTTSPGAKLDVNGTSNLRDTINAYPQPGFENYVSAVFSNNTSATIRFLHNLGVSLMHTDASQHLAFGTNGATERMRIEATTGNLGIGTTGPGYTLTVNGTAWCTSGAWSGSDLRWKKNIETLNNPLDKLSRLRGISYDWKREDFKGNNFPEGRQIGIIAQELEKEFPELVTTDKEGYKAIAYDRFTAVLLEAIKAQWQIQQKQQNQLQEQQKRIEVLEAKLNAGQ